jgi:hypothetical protein
MSCKDPNTEIFAEISETLETLGSKIENARNFILTVYVGEMEEDVLSYAKNILNIQVLRAETEKEGGLYEISGNPRRAVWFCKKRMVCLEVL